MNLTSSYLRSQGYDTSGPRAVKLDPKPLRKSRGQGRKGLAKSRILHASTSCTSDGRTLCAVIPIYTTTECNTGGTRWKKHGRAKGQMEAMDLIIGRKPLPRLPVRVELTRVGPKSLDQHDNLPSAFKHLVDCLARLYGIGDHDKRFEWVYLPQERGDYAVKISITSKGSE